MRSPKGGYRVRNGNFHEKPDKQSEQEMGIFTKNRTSNIGLDVSSTAVKLLEFGKELVDNEPRYRILNYAVVPLPTNAIVEKSVADFGDLPY